MSEGDSHESDILFCPFCGDVDALEVQHLEGAILYPAYRVACDNCGAAFAIRSDIDEWNTRALPAVQPMTVQETARCEYCDGTGDVHAIDGEWRGYCSCGAGATIRALPAAQPHVNETPKSEHVPGDMLTPATKGERDD